MITFRGRPGNRPAKLPEIVAISWATGFTVAQRTGAGTIADRVQCAARATNHSAMEGMRETLLHYLELNDYLDEQASPATAADTRHPGLCRGVVSARTIATLRGVTLAEAEAELRAAGIHPADPAVTWAEPDDQWSALRRCC